MGSGFGMLGRMFWAETIRAGAGTERDVVEAERCGFAVVV